MSSRDSENSSKSSEDNDTKRTSSSEGGVLPTIDRWLADLEVRARELLEVSIPTNMDAYHAGVLFNQTVTQILKYVELRQQYTEAGSDEQLALAAAYLAHEVQVVDSTLVSGTKRKDPPSP